MLSAEDVNIPQGLRHATDVEFPVPFAQTGEETEELPGSNVVSDPAYYSSLLVFQARGKRSERRGTFGAALFLRSFEREATLE